MLIPKYQTKWRKFRNTVIPSFKITCRCTRWNSRLRHCATSRKVAGSIPDGVIGIFHRHNPSGRTIALGSTQPLTGMSTRNISWGVKTAGAYGWQPYHLHVQIFLKFESLKLLEPSGPVQSCNGIALPFKITCHHAFRISTLDWNERQTLCCYALKNFSICCMIDRMNKRKTIEWFFVLGNCSVNSIGETKT